MRVVSLVPAATEIVAALGAEGSLVGISHECDWPRPVRQLPRVTTTPIDPGRASGAIDAEVRRLHAEGRPVIGVDGGALAGLRPDLILTQDLCDVCAVVDGDVRALASALDPAPALLPLRARTLEGIFADIAAVGAALDRVDEARELVASLRRRLERLERGDGSPRRRVVCLEWLDPIYLAGHWVPELIEAAGGRDVGAPPGAHSRRATIEEVEALRPELILVAPCGFDLARAGREYAAFEEVVRMAGGRPPAAWGMPVWLIDGNAYTSRPGPRVVDGAERIAGALGGRGQEGIRRWRVR
jgi:iron complex transport system substrate-binding protein